MQFIETSHDISLLGKIAASTRVWAMPLGAPEQSISISVTSHGEVLPLGNVFWTVYYGGSFDGDPYVSTSTHSGGLMQATNVFAGPVEVADVIFNGRIIIPSNLRTSSYSSGGTAYRRGYGGFPVVLEIMNATLETIHLTATFVFKSCAIT
jgi:hypothetical protein